MEGLSIVMFARGSNVAEVFLPITQPNDNDI